MECWTQKVKTLCCRTSLQHSRSKVTREVSSLFSCTPRCKVRFLIDMLSLTHTRHSLNFCSILLCDKHRRRASPPLGEVPCLRATLHRRGEQAAHALQRRRWPTWKLLEHLLYILGYICNFLNTTISLAIFLMKSISVNCRSLLPEFPGGRLPPSASLPLHFLWCSPQDTQVSAKYQCIKPN